MSNPIQNIESTKITPETVRKYICPEATDQEIAMFLTLCKEQNLNPFLKEVYLVKYGNKPAAQIIAKEVFFKRAAAQKDYRGIKAGTIVKRGEEIVYTTGSFSLKGDSVLGGWAEVYREGMEPFRIEVAFDEYAGRKADGQLNAQWAGKPATMIRKTACVQALREAYPMEFQQMYDESELDAIQGETIPSETVKEELISENDIIDLLEMIESSGVNVRQVLEAYRIKSLEELPLVKLSAVKSRLAKAIEAKS